MKDTKTILDIFEFGSNISIRQRSRLIYSITSNETVSGVIWLYFTHRGLLFLSSRKQRILRHTANWKKESHVGHARLSNFKTH